MFSKILDHTDLEGNNLCVSGCPLERTIKDGETREVAVFLKHKKGHRVPVVVKTIPIYDNKKLIGAVEIFNSDYKLFKTIRDLNKYKSLAFQDKLTHLPNRHYIDQYLKQTNVFVDNLLSVVFIDIDDFKVINDTYGHAFGDVVLENVATIIKNSVKSTDEVFRYGGEEFMAIIFEDSSATLKNVCERIRRNVEEIIMYYNEESISVTISIGCTNRQNSEEIEHTIKRADECMYQSKNKGKNQATYDIM